MKGDKVLKQCPEAECRLVKYFLVARKFKDRVSYEKNEKKEITNLKNRYCTIKFENIFAKCTSLTEIPEGLFEKTIKAKNILITLVISSNFFFVILPLLIQYIFHL